MPSNPANFPKTQSDNPFETQNEFLSEPLSEPFNVWNYKPWWCQPWSIVLTGAGIMTGSWLLFRAVWLTSLVSVPLLIWMGYFLVIYPRLVRQAVEAEPDRFSVKSEE
jgi:hypothetical protein